MNSSIDRPTAINAVGNALAAVDHAELGSTRNLPKLPNDAIGFTSSSGTGTFSVVALDHPEMIEVFLRRAMLPNVVKGLHTVDSL